MKLIDRPISLNEIKLMTQRMHGGLVKGVIDITKEIMVLDADLHADEEKYLLELGSKQDDLWGINLYPDLTNKDFIEFDSMINVRPRLNNFTRGITNKELQVKIVSIVNKLVLK